MDEVDRAPNSEPRVDDLGPQERTRLLGRYGRRFFSGDAICREGEPATEAFLLQEGRVRLLKRIGMTERNLGVLRGGDLFGECAVIQGASYGSTAIALGAGVVLAVDRATFAALVETHPQLTMQIVEQLASRLRAAEDQVEIMMLKSVQSRVTGALLKLAGRATGSAEIAISPVELSTRVGLDVDAVKRTVLQMRDREYLRISDERIEIPDVEALRQLHTLFGAKDELAGTEE